MTDVLVAEGMVGEARETAPPVNLPRLGFLGAGWIGRSRMGAIAAEGVAAVAAVAAVSDPSDEMANAAREAAPGAEVAASLDDLLAMELDGIVIATPSALHAEQAVRALEAGAAVFCQKPLGRTAAECRRVECERLVDVAAVLDRIYGR